MHAERRHRSGLAVFLAAAVSCLLAQPGQAQYFGRNKVRYDPLDFQVLKTPHFDIYYYPQEQAAAEQAARLAERWHARLSRLLDHQFTRRQPLVLYANHAHFEQTNTIDEVGEGTGGVTEALKRRVVLPFAGPLAETDHVLGHELVHAFQYDVTSGGPGGLPGALRLPLWFIEGMAEYLSLGPVDANTAMWIRDSAKREKLPTFKQLNDPRFFPYRYGHALWSYVGGRWGDRAIGRILKVAGRGGDPERAFQEVLGVDAKVLVNNWHESIRETYRPYLGRPEASRYGRAVITEKNAGEMNVGPALSPDGRRLVFLSEKGLFAIEMFLADVETGHVIRKIVKTAVDPHYDTLEFIESSGDWDPTGRRFVFAAMQKGKPVLSILDVERGRMEREVRLPQLGEIEDPAFSPDGHRVAFSANVGGLLDLYLYDLQNGSLRRLTDDAFAELQPAWSPDGRRIAFVTDRFTTRLDELAFGDYRIGLLDVESGAVTEAPSFEGSKNIDPHFSADGKSLFHLADQNGITNVYRVDLATGRQFQVTDLVTGVSGITSLSPALTVGGSRLAFSVYEEGKHRIYEASSPEVLAGGPVVSEGRRAAMLPPTDRGRDEVVALQSNSTLGLPDRRIFASAPYKPRLSLDYVGGQAGVGIGMGYARGAYTPGGVSMLFSDMLGNHNLVAVVESTGDIRDIGGVVGYENRKSRWDWGAYIQQIPYLSGDFAEGPSPDPGVFLQQSRIFREVDRSVSAYAAYPFSRVQRLEFGTAFRSIGFSIEQETLGFSTRSGQLLFDETQKLPAPSGVHLAEASAALVHDSSLFGATSPILGRRYRLEATPTFGSVNFTGLLADVRQYVMPVRPYTIAARVVHYGRYGSGGEDSRLTPLFIGYPTLLRGYDVNSFDASECGASSNGSCPVFDQLLGSRVLVGNLELRFPLIGAFGGRRLYGPIPIELLAFADGGMAWTSANKASFLGGSRRWVRSVGGGARVNVLGYAVVEIDWVRPLDRPEKRSLWQFNFAPGF